MKRPRGIVDGGVARLAAAAIGLGIKADARIGEASATTRAGSSFEPSSTTTISKSWQVWARTDSMARCKAGARL